MPARAANTKATGQPDITSITRKFLRVLEKSTSEEDLRIGIEIVLHEAIPDLPTPRYEKAVKASAFRGRADAVHRGLVIEYESPRSMRKAPKREHALDQVREYLAVISLGDQGNPRGLEPGVLISDISYSQEQEEALAATVGLATDGESFIFVQRQGRKWTTDARTLDEDTVEKLLLWLRAMNRKDLSPENLITDFGPQSKLAADIVGVLARLVHSKKHPKANVIYQEWRRIFGIVYGTEQLERAHGGAEARALAGAYRVDVGVEFPIVLFAVHTYYALLMKMLATEVIVAQGGISDTFIGGLTRTDLKNQLRQLESGDILERHNIRNAIEQDFFGWYPEAWTAELQDVLWTFAQTLSAYDIGTFQLKPDRARDLLKDLYHGLIPETVRHALGEYYTPDWLAEHTLDLAGYDGDPRKTLLDPSCGSGTFLLLAIQRVRQWLADNQVEWGSNERKREAVSLIRRNIVGFDLNPLAVIASRTNYLFALGPYLRFRASGADFEVPVYLTDSVLLPGRSKQQTGSLFAQDTIPFPMTVGVFSLPREVVVNRQVPALMNLLHDCIADDHSCTSFVNRARKQLSLAEDGPATVALRTLFDTMKELDRQGKNRVWAKLIRNRYASLFFREYFDFVVGNPPHVNWEALTPDWRKAAEDEYKDYGLFTLKGLKSRHGGGKKDIAALFTYAVTDHFLKNGGVLALVVHVSLFKTSGAGEGYRRFQLGRKEPFRIEAVHDFKSFQPFQTHPSIKIKTRTATFRATKGKPTTYPIPYTVWRKLSPGCIPGSLSWTEAAPRLESSELIATPLRGTSKDGILSPWLTVRKGDLSKCRRLVASSSFIPHYVGREGANSAGLNGAYFLDVLERFPDGTVLVRNMHDEGKIKCPKVQMAIEGDLLYPLLRGYCVARWTATPSGHILMLQDPASQRGYPEAWLQETYPLTWKYIKKFDTLLRARKAFRKFFDPEKDPFYSMYSVTTDTLAPVKVAWMDISSTVKAVVLAGPARNEMPIPEHTVMFLTTTSVDEAHYVAAVLNSDPVNSVVTGYIVDNHISTHPIQNIAIPKFSGNSALHQTLVALSKKAHACAAVNDTGGVSNAEAAINSAVADLW